MVIIHGPLVPRDPALPTVRLAVDRQTLAKRRWRGRAEDGGDFGFDLQTPLQHGQAFHVTKEAIYVIAQKYEPVLELAFASWGRQSADAARVGWLIGNLHFPVEIAGDVLRVADDPALRQLGAREGLPFVVCKRIFRPISGGHSHGH